MRLLGFHKKQIEKPHYNIHKLYKNIHDCKINDGGHIVAKRARARARARALPHVRTKHTTARSVDCSRRAPPREF